MNFTEELPGKPGEFLKEEGGGGEGGRAGGLVWCDKQWTSIHRKGGAIFAVVMSIELQCKIWQVDQQPKACLWYVSFISSLQFHPQKSLIS